MSRAGVSWTDCLIIHRETGEEMPQYKVLTQKDRYFSGKFSPEKLEEAINGYAHEGWRVVSATTARIPALGRDRDELIVILERG